MYDCVSQGGMTLIVVHLHTHTLYAYSWRFMFFHMQVKAGNPQEAIAYLKKAHEMAKESMCVLRNVD